MFFFQKNLFILFFLEAREEDYMVDLWLSKNITIIQIKIQNKKKGIKDEVMFVC